MDRQTDGQTDRQTDKPRPYPELISYRLTSMGTQKNVPKKQKIKFWKLPCLLLKKKFYENFQFGPIENPFSSKEDFPF